jgi:hypothetical protein
VTNKSSVCPTYLIEEFIDEADGFKVYQ